MEPKSTMNKSLSESNISELTDEVITCATLTDELSPTNFVSRRVKRKATDNLDCELSNFKEEIRSMISIMLTAQEKQINKITPVLNDIKEANANIEKSMAFLASQNEELKKKLDAYELQSKKDKEYITILEDKVEDLQRENRKSNIQIKNVPKVANENEQELMNMVVKLSENVGHTITGADIKDIYRLKNKKVENNGPIVVELSSTILKKDFLKSVKTYNIRHKEKLCARHLGHTKNEYTPIYVSEQLTAKAARLHFVARDLIKSTDYKYCWTSHGRVYIRRSEDTPVILVRSEQQVQNLLLAK
ncbi:structural maintenance of chromosomes protein 2-like [Ostrinia furnacalis]|uniref:structural maintenance of chromosomes protein 2-like n=1 Tax=Ostrinia furnacalis TaxID=93504 RepID=UPI00103A9AFE|nr:structural maintenance of chromosomes protein 2-like [Ostrinia furnacalis]